VLFRSQIEMLKDVYEIIPGFIACTIAIVVVSLFTAKPSSEVEAEFDEAVNKLV
jgi:sodium/proline symporter